MIQLARFLARTVSGVNGPGHRAVVWVQGCPLRCPGCFNPGFLEFGGHHEHVRVLTEGQVVDLVLQEHARQPLEGVTFSGGEPMAQADGLAEVATRLREAGLNVVVFTGYTRTQLQDRATPGMRRLLQQSDLLVAGPYVERLRTGRPDLRGSWNQEVLYLTDRIRPPATPVAQVELQVAGDGTVHLTGFPSRPLRDAVAGLLERVG